MKITSTVPPIDLSCYKMSLSGVSSPANQTNTTNDNSHLNSEQLDFLSEQKKLSQYLAEREADFKKKYGDSLPSTMVAVAFPVSEDGRSPFVTADQQKIIDSITDEYIGMKDISGLMEKLAEKNVHPDQIASNASYYIKKDGIIVDKDGCLLFKNSLDIVC